MTKYRLRTAAIIEDNRAEKSDGNPTWFKGWISSVRVSVEHKGRKMSKNKRIKKNKQLLIL